MKATKLLLLLMMIVLASQYPFNQSCWCINGGECQPTNFKSPCYCSKEYIGKYCETYAKVLEDRSQYTGVGFNFTHYVFAPGRPGSYKFTFDTCMLSNPNDLQTLVFLTSDQDDGGPSYEPSILSSAKIKVKEGGCLTFVSPYIQIQRKVEQPFWRIIIGVRAMPKAFKNIFYRTIPGQNHREISQEVIDDQPQFLEEYEQLIYVKITYEEYKQTLTEVATKILVKGVVGIGIMVALSLFCKIVLFSYGIETKGILLWINRCIRAFWRKICPIKGNERNYRNYLRYRKGVSEQAEGLRSEQCAICLQLFQMQDLVQETMCRHVYHEACLQLWQQKNQNCPLCRQQLKKSSENWANSSHGI